MEFLGKYILITGASQGIGLAVAQRFSELGANLILVARDSVKLDAVKSQLQQQCPSQEFMAISCDLSNPSNIPEFFSMLKTNGITSLDVLVNNAGVMIDSILQQQKLEDISLMVNINVISTILMCQASLRFFLKKRKGCIINISSIIGEQGAAGQSVYSATKAAVIGFSKSLAKELAKLNINVNIVSPGFIDTDMTKKYDEDTRNAVIEKIGFNRAGTATEVANAVVFLASSQAKYITGHNLQINGGMII